MTGLGGFQVICIDGKEEVMKLCAVTLFANN